MRRKRRAGLRRRTEIHQQLDRWITARIEALQRSSRRNRLLLRFWLGFTGILAGQLLLLFVWAGPTWKDQTVTGTAQLTAAIFQMLGVAAYTEGSRVYTPFFAAQIIPECTAILPILLLVAGILAYPSRWRAKGVGLALGIPLILLVNQVRLVSLFYIGDRFPDVFEVAHLLVWQTLIILVTVLFWLAWLQRAGHAHAHGAPSPTS